MRLHAKNKYKLALALAHTVDIMNPHKQEHGEAKMSKTELSKKEALEFFDLPADQKLKIIIGVFPEIEGKIEGMPIKNGDKISETIKSWVKKETSRLEKMGTDLTDDELDDLDEANDKLARRFGIAIISHFDNPYMRTVV